MQDNKYYTPNIEDIRIGYECEANIKEFGVIVTRDEEWRHIIIKGVGQEVIYYHSLGMYRTCSLTKEQIEAEGWEFYTFPIEIEGTEEDIFIEGWEKTITEDLWYTLRKENDTYLIEKRWYVNSVSQVWETLYKGTCPSINEFRQIIKLLNIC